MMNSPRLSGQFLRAHSVIQTRLRCPVAKYLFIALAIVIVSFHSLSSFADDRGPFLDTTTSVLLVTHASDSWDRGSADSRTPAEDTNRIRPTLNEVIASFLSAGRPIIGIVSPGEPTDRGLPFGLLRGKLVESENGEHRLRTGAKSFVITGGNLTVCSCATVRSTVANELRSGPSQLRLFFVTDAIYDYFPIMGVPSLPPNEHRLDLIIKRMSDRQLQRFLTEEYVSPGFLCGEPLGIKRDIQFRVFRDGRSLFVVGYGKSIVEMNFGTWEILSQPHTTNHE